MDRTKINREQNKKLVKLFQDKGIMTCELKLKGCMGGIWLSFAHLHKRTWYYDKDPDLLSDFNQVVVACMNCHQVIEKDAELTKQMFEILRPKI